MAVEWCDAKCQQTCGLTAGLPNSAKRRPLFSIVTSIEHRLYKFLLRKLCLIHEGSRLKPMRHMLSLNALVCRAAGCSSAYLDKLHEEPLC